MMTRIVTIGVIAVGVLALQASSSSAGLQTGFPTPGQNCKAFHHSAQKSSKWKSVAQRRARTNWSAKMWNTYGFHYRKWSKGQFRHYDCHKSGGKHRCKAAAYPCHV